jgi:hypothetical protein
MAETIRSQRRGIDSLAGETQMTATIIQAIAKGTAKANSDFETLVQLGLFSGLGLLISVGVNFSERFGFRR